MAILISLNISDMLVTGLVYKGLVTFDYFRFLVPGIVVMGLFSAATDTGRRIWLALREGVVQYYMTLPVRTSGLVAAYILSGGFANLLGVALPRAGIGALSFWVILRTIRIRGQP